MPLDQRRHFRGEISLASACDHYCIPDYVSHRLLGLCDWNSATSAGGFPRLAESARPKVQSAPILVSRARSGGGSRSVVANDTAAKVWLYLGAALSGNLDDDEQSYPIIDRSASTNLASRHPQCDGNGASMGIIERCLGYAPLRRASIPAEPYMKMPTASNSDLGIDLTATIGSIYFSSAQR